MLIGLYPRVSTQEQADHGYSIDEQIERMKSYCQAMGWTVYKVYTDAGFSGGDTERPGLQNMIRDVKDGKLDKVLVYKLDRLSRSQLDTLYLIEKVFLANNVDFVSMSENFDTSTPFGRAMIGILAVFAQLEREQIKERMKMGKYARAKQGKFHGSNNVPTGYDYIDGEFVTHEFEKMQIIEAYQLAAEGISPYKIAKLLNAKGYYRRSGEWNDRNVRRTLRSKYYIGYMKYAGEWFQGTHESFIDDDLYYKVQSILDERSEQHMKYNRRAGKATSYLGGFLYCKHCGAKYTKSTCCPPKKSGGYYRYVKYVCNSQQGRKAHEYLIKDRNCKNKKWNMEELDSVVFEEIKKLAIDPDYVAKINASKTEDERPKIIKKEIENIEKQISRLMDLYTIGQMPMDVLQDKIKELNEKKLNLNNDLQKIIEESQKKLSQEEAIKITQSFGEILERNDFDEIRAVIAYLIEKIVIDNNDVEIHWAFV